MNKPKTPRLRYTVVSDGDVIARFLLHEDCAQFMKHADKMGLFGRIGATAYNSEGDLLYHIPPTKED